MAYQESINEKALEIDQEDIGKVYHTIHARVDLERILNQIKEQQNADPRLTKIRKRLEENDHTLIPYYCIHNNLLFTCPTSRENHWKLYISKIP